MTIRVKDVRDYLARLHREDLIKIFECRHDDSIIGRDDIDKLKGQEIYYAEIWGICEYTDFSEGEILLIGELLKDNPTFSYINGWIDLITDPTNGFLEFWYKNSHDIHSIVALSTGDAFGDDDGSVDCCVYLLNLLWDLNYPEIKEVIIKNFVPEYFDCSPDERDKLLEKIAEYTLSQLADR